MMKLALIRRQFSRTGGAELYLQRLLDRLAATGWELHLLTESWEPSVRGVAVHQIAIHASRANRAREFAEAIHVETAKEKFDCVFSLDRTLSQDVYRAGDGVHRVWLQRRRQFAPWWRKPFVGFGAFHKMMLDLETQTFDPKNTGRVIANSEMVKQEILENFYFPEERIHVIRNGVDVPRFQRGERGATRAKFGVADDEFLLLFVGSGWERKGLRFLLGAMSRCGNPSLNWLALIHDGFERGRSHASSPGMATQTKQERPSIPLEKIKLLVVGKGRKPRNSPPNVLFSGPMSDVENAYAAADLFVFLPIYEPASNVVCEALAAGLPVVTSGFNGASELIKDGVNGTVLPDPSDLDRLAHALGFWWAQPRWPQSAPEASLSLDRNVIETISLLELVAQEKRR